MAQDHKDSRNNPSNRGDPSSSLQKPPPQTKSCSFSDCMVIVLVPLLVIALLGLMLSNISSNFHHHETLHSTVKQAVLIEDKSIAPSEKDMTLEASLLADSETNSTALPISYDPYKDLLAQYKSTSIAPKAHLLPVSPGPTIKFAMAGDINYARHVDEKIQGHQMDYTFPLQKMKPFVDGIDIKYANLESGITESNKPKKEVKECDPPDSKGCCELRCHFKTSPRVLDGIMEYAGFNLLSIENNHIEDWEGGREDTQHILDQYNVAWIDSSHPYKLKGFKGCDLDFFAYDITFSRQFFDFKKIAMISVLRTAESEAFKVVFVHAGEEYKPYYNKYQQTFAEAAIDNGADMVVMSHAHVAQPYVMYKGKYIFYGLGNFVFDQHFSMRVREFLMVTFELKNCKEVVNLDVWNGLLNKQFQPELVSLNMTTKDSKGLLPSSQDKGNLRGV